MYREYKLVIDEDNDDDFLTTGISFGLDASCKQSPSIFIEQDHAHLKKILYDWENRVKISILLGLDIEDHLRIDPPPKLLITPHEIEVQQRVQEYQQVKHQEQKVQEYQQVKHQEQRVQEYQQVKHQEQKVQERHHPYFPKPYTIYGDNYEKKIYVYGFGQVVNAKELKDYFSVYGEVENTYILNDVNRISRGSGFVSFKSKSCVDDVFRDDRVHILKNCKIIVKRAYPKKTFNTCH